MLQPLSLRSAQRCPLSSHARSAPTVFYLLTHDKQLRWLALTIESPKRLRHIGLSTLSANSPNGTAVCVVAFCVVAFCLGVFPPNPCMRRRPPLCPFGHSLRSLLVLPFVAVGVFLAHTRKRQAPTARCPAAGGGGTPCLVSRGGSRSARPHSRRAQPPAPPRSRSLGLVRGGLRPLSRPRSLSRPLAPLGSLRSGSAVAASPLLFFMQG